MREIPPALRHFPPELAAYCLRFPTAPEWFSEVDPDEIVTGHDPADFPCMADAEDGEQPWLPRLPPPGEDLAELELTDADPAPSRAA